MTDRRTGQPDTGERRRSVDKIPCPECGCYQSIVLPYRPRREAVENAFGRVRLCDNGHRYDTYEYVSPLPKISIPPKPAQK